MDYQPEQTLRQIDQICDAFEEAWKTEKSPRIEDFLSMFSGERSKLLVELLKLEISLRQEAGEAPKRSDYALRFVKDPSVIELVFGVAVGGCTPQRDVSSTVFFPDSGKNPLQEPKTILDRIDRYRIDEVLGEGGFGRVYRGYDESLKREVAIKVPRLDRFGESVDVTGYLAEARTVASLEHPHIVPVYDIGSTADVPIYVVSKLVRGESLQDQLKKAPLTAQEAARLMVPIAEALHYAHQHGLIHRDVKPANILMDVQGQPLLTDFGLALHEEQQAQHKNEVSGSPAYMAPEQVKGKSQYLDGRTDVWALGVILYELLAGRRPFQSENLHDLFEEICEREPKPLRMIDGDVCPRLEEITTKCLRKHSADRYSTAADMAKDLRSWLKTSRDTNAGVFFSTIGWRTISFITVPVLVTAVFIFRPADRGQQPETDLNGDRIIQSAPQRLSGSVIVRIWNPNDSNRRGLSLREPNALPLQVGDQIRIEGRANQPTFLYLIWVGSDGTVQPLFPWEAGKWILKNGKEKPGLKAASPETADQGWELGGGPGMETVFLLGREVPLTPEAADALKVALANLPIFPLETPRDAIWIAGQQVAATSGNREYRGLKLNEAKTIDDPLLQAQATLQTHLKPHFPLIEVVSFANQGESK